MPTSFSAAATSFAPNRSFWTRCARSITSKMSPSTSRSPATYARPKPSSPGAVTRRRSASGDRTTTVVRASGGPSRLPSYADTATGRSVPSSSARRSATLMQRGCHMSVGGHVLASSEPVGAAHEAQEALRERGGDLVEAVVEPRRRHDLVDEAPALGAVRIDRLPVPEEREQRAPRRAPWDRHRSTRARDQPETELGKPEARVVGADDARRERRQLEPRAEARPVQSHDESPLQLVETPRERPAQPDHVRGCRVRERGELVEVTTRAERRPVAAHDDG